MLPIGRIQPPGVVSASTSQVRTSRPRSTVAGRPSASPAAISASGRGSVVVRATLLRPRPARVGPCGTPDRGFERGRQGRQVFGGHRRRRRVREGRDAAQDRVGARPCPGEIARGRERHGEEPARGDGHRPVVAPGHGLAQRMDGPSVRVLGTDLVEPGSVLGTEVPGSTASRVERRTQDHEVVTDRGGHVHAGLHLGVAKVDAKCSRHVVRAGPVPRVRRPAARELVDADRGTKLIEMQAHQRQVNRRLRRGRIRAMRRVPGVRRRRGGRGSGRRVRRRVPNGRGLVHGPREQSRVFARHVRPHHRAPVLAAPAAQCLSHLVVEQDGRDRARQRIGVLERDQEAASIPQELAGVGVGGRDDGGSRRERVGERAGRHLLRVPVRGHEHVGGHEPGRKL